MLVYNLQFIVETLVYNLQFSPYLSTIYLLISTSSTQTGWWYTYPSEKYEFVSWEYYSQYMEKIIQHIPNYHQQSETELGHPLASLPLSSKNHGDFKNLLEGDKR